MLSCGYSLYITDNTMKSSTKKIIAIAQKKGQIRSGDLVSIGVSRTMLAYLSNNGILRRIARGVYIPTDRIPEHETFLAVAAAVPNGVICLLSALQFHEITTQMPMETWVAIDRNCAVPKFKQPRLRIVKLSGQAFSEGIEEYPTDGMTIRVYCLAKTVVDCFKFRNRIGLDIAREALVDCIAQKKATRDEIYHYARLCRMDRVMRPYLEMV